MAGRPNREYSPLPRTTVDGEPWQALARCRGAGQHYFFAPDREQDRARVERERAAKSICAGCPVRSTCLGHALTAHESHGIWGGLSERDRKDLLTTLP